VDIKILRRVPRRLLDGVAMPVPLAARPSQDGRVVAEK